jgi:hypothetical protein
MIDLPDCLCGAPQISLRQGRMQDRRNKAIRLLLPHGEIIS